MLAVESWHTDSTMGGCLFSGSWILHLPIQHPLRATTHSTIYMQRINKMINCKWGKIKASTSKFVAAATPCTWRLYWRQPVSKQDNGRIWNEEINSPPAPCVLRLLVVMSFVEGGNVNYIVFSLYNANLHIWGEPEQAQFWWEVCRHVSNGVMHTINQLFLK